MGLTENLKNYLYIWKMKLKVWTALLVSIAVTMILSLVNWLYSRSRALANKNELKEVGLDIHWLFLFGLLMSKGFNFCKYR